MPDEKDLLQPQDQGPSNQQQMTGLLQNTQQQLGLNQNIPGQFMDTMSNNSLQSMGNNLNPMKLASTAVACVTGTASNLANGMQDPNPKSPNNPVPGPNQLSGMSNDVGNAMQSGLSNLSPMNINKGPQPGGGGGGKKDDNNFQQAGNIVNQVASDPQVKSLAMEAVVPGGSQLASLADQNQNSGPGKTPQLKPPGFDVGA